MPAKNLFKLIVPADKLHPTFRSIRSERGSAPARWMLNKAYQTFTDADGNFLEQFQTAGFHTRFFELYLHAYLTRSRFQIDRSKAFPDFLATKSGLTIAIEATTVNPSTAGVLATLGKKIEDLSAEELQSYQNDELSIRFGSPLISKLRKRYWEHDHCKGKPFVIAIEAFHDKGSLKFTDNSLSRYVFGIHHTGDWTVDGKLEVKGHAVKEHTIGDKTIPSGFFNLPDAENVSAIVFTNSGTSAKFSRMGFQHGKFNNLIIMKREGFALDPHPDARDASFFAYDLDKPPLVEDWGQGLVVLHNPKCLYPIPRGYFPGAIDHYIVDGRMATDGKNWHPMTSQTLIMYFGIAKKNVADLPIRTPSISIFALQKREFQSIVGLNHDETPVFEERGWYSDETTSFLGVILWDKIDSDWGCVILARNLVGLFCAIETRSSLESREQARQAIYEIMVELLCSPQRYFKQGNEGPDVC